jgi:glyoxylase-like metal-dependent hydrolase (beta-lactamase superfamily II)
MRNLLLLPLLILSACSSPPHTANVAVADRSRKTETIVVVGDSRVGSYVSSWRGFRTSSYWIEGPTGLILVDTQFLPSAAEEFVNEAERVTGKKALLAIVLHPNPDKFNGTAVFQKRGIRVVTSAQVLARIPAVHQLRTEWFYERYKPDYPVEQPKPESFGDHTTELSAGGITVKAHVLGAGCSEAHVAVEFDQNLFVGDLVTIGFHSWLELGLLPEWVKRMDELAALKPKYVRTGRGGSGAADLLTREKEYLQTVIQVVRNRKLRQRNAPYSDEIGESVANEIFRRYPSYDYPIFVENGMEAVWNRTKL